MSTTNPENSLQTATRWTWNVAKAAYVGCAVAETFTTRYPKRRYTNMERMKWRAYNYINAKRFIEDTVELRQRMDAALKITIADEDAYVASADYIVDKLDSLTYFCNVDMDRRDPMWSEVQKCIRWACALLPVWKKIQIIRNRQARLVEDKERVASGVESQLWVDLERLDYPVCELFFKRGIRFCVYIFAIAILCAVVGIDFFGCIEWWCNWVCSLFSSGAAVSVTPTGSAVPDNSILHWIWTHLIWIE